MSAFTFLSSSFLVVTASVTASVAVWGAGGNGNLNGAGGSGGAFASASIRLNAGTYTCSVAGPGGYITNPYTTSASLGYNPLAGDTDLYGLSSSLIVSGSTVIISAVGGSSTGIISHQLTQGSGSLTPGTPSGSIFYVQGGLGGTPVGNTDGCGGGSAGGFNSATGTASLGTPGFSDNTIGPDSRSSAAQGGYTSGSSGGPGGNGSYYDAGPNLNRIVPAQNGGYPGGGGGGSYVGYAPGSEGFGAGGAIVVTY